MTKTVQARAPAKAILFGEHYVVYGAPGLVAAIEPRNEITLSAEESDRPGLEYRSTLKENDIDVEWVGGEEAHRTSAPSAPRPLAPPPIHPYAALYRKLAGEYPALGRLRIHARVKKAWPLKGVGNSASLGVALGAGLRAMAGEKRTTPQIAFEDGQSADEVAHGGGRPSGIDASAAAYGGVIEFQKDFAHPLKPKIKPMEMAPMREAGFLLIDTHAAGEPRASTAELVAGFGRAHGIEKKPGELSASEREEVCAPYQTLFLQAQKALVKGDWKRVGELMDLDHRLLREKGVSSPGIEKAVSICKSTGALGAKLSGAGGVGGVVIALVERKSRARLEKELGAAGFKAYAFKVSEEGASAKFKK